MRAASFHDWMTREEKVSQAWVSASISQLQIQHLQLPYAPAAMAAYHNGRCPQTTSQYKPFLKLLLTDYSPQQQEELLTPQPTWAFPPSV